MKIKKAVITAAGWGTRFLPITKSQPKEMLPLLNRPIIQYSVEEAIACGVDLIVIVTSLGKRSIEDYFDRHFELETMLENKGETSILEEVRRLSDMVDIGFIRQKEQLGLGHAVLTARNMIGNEPFYLMLPDDLFEKREQVLKGMEQIFNTYQSDVIAVKRVKLDEVNRYGIVKYNQVEDRVLGVTDLVEKPRIEDAPSSLAVMGRYLLTPEIFDSLQHTVPGRNGEIQLTDALRRMIPQRTIYAYEFCGERWDAGTLPGWLETTFALALKDPDLAPRLRKFLVEQLNRQAESNRFSGV